MPEPYFQLPWDVSPRMDLVFALLREDSSSYEFLKRTIKRSNKMHKMFQRGRGHVEYVGLAKRFGLKALETVTFSTTRFTSSSFEQWEKNYSSYNALMKRQKMIVKKQSRSQDYVVNLRASVDVMKHLTDDKKSSSQRTTVENCHMASTSC